MPAACGEVRGAIKTAHRIKNACGQVVRDGIAVGHCTRDPAADLRDALRPVSTRHHAAIIDPKRTAELLRVIGETEGHPMTRAALQLSARLLLRPGGLPHMEWAWIDRDAATLTVPAETMKRTEDDKAMAHRTLCHVRRRRWRRGANCTPSPTTAATSSHRC